MTRMSHQLEGILLDNRYEIIEKIGIGGMADVYKGVDKLLGRSVAIKILHQNFAGDEDFVIRFKREAQAAGKLSHPNIVSMYDVGFDQGLHYIIMEYVSGQTLKEYIQEHRPLSVDQAVKFTTAIAEGLEHAHLMGLVHCDIKPHNILITDTGRLKVTDFGIARAINTGATLLYTNSVMGSAHYISPEQASGKSVNVSTDIYSLGVVLYEMLTGEVPFTGETPISVALKHVQDTVEPPRKLNPLVPPMLEAVVLKALAKKPEERFLSVADMIKDLRMSQGFTMSKVARPMPYDFATQMLPPIEPDPIVVEEDFSKPVEKKPEGLGFFHKLNSLPTRYIYIGAGLLFLLAFLWTFLSFGNFWSNSTVDVPNVIGKQLSVAQHILEDNHLKVTHSEVSNPDIPIGQVISQSPEPGAAVKEKRVVHLVVSKGGGEITVPDLKGLTLEQAKDKIKSVGLSIGKVTMGADGNQPDGVILSQSLQGGTKASKGNIVDVVLNKAKSKAVVVPDVVGMTLKDAREALAALGLSVSKIDGTNMDTAVVKAITPNAGSELEINQSVEITAEARETEKKDKAEPASANATKGTIDVTVPAGKKTQELRLVLVDDTGSRVVYEGTNKPGERVVKEVSGVGNVRIQVYLNGALVQEQTL